MYMNVTVTFRVCNITGNRLPRVTPCNIPYPFHYSTLYVQVQQGPLRASPVPWVNHPQIRLSPVTHSAQGGNTDNGTLQRRGRIVLTALSASTVR